MKRKINSNNILKTATIILYSELTGVRKKKYRYSLSPLRKFEWDLVTVYKLDNMKIEVRQSEDGHNMPHFHVTLKSKKIDAVYTISPIKLYQGKIDAKSDKAVRRWAENNRDLLVDMWNKFHGYRIKVS
jgi:hypothetical protein